MKKRILSIALVLSLAFAVAPSAFAVGTVVKTAEELQAALKDGGELVLGADIGVKDTLTVKTSTTLDLNGYKLTVITSRHSGIVIDLGQTFTVLDSKYSENTPSSGKLYVNGYRAGIQTSGATLMIHSGVVEATGQWATGIGGVADGGYYDGGTVIINGGIVTATGGCPGVYGGAGIGGMGYGAGSGANGNGGTVTINGGMVTATGGQYGAGIGGGGSAGSLTDGGNGSTLAINGGVVKARGGAGAYDIGSGGGASSDGGSLKATGGTIELSKNGTNVKAPSFKNCVILGDGSGSYKGTYDANGTRIALEDGSTWARAGITSAVSKGLVPQNLQSDYTQAATRAEFCALAVALYETVKGAEITERKTFADTTDPNIEKMGALAVVSGVGNDRFDPNGTLTREQAATMLARLAEAVGKSLPERSATFADRASISSWAIAPVGQVQAADIMGGVGNNQFDPSGPYTREQSIVTILRLFDAMH